MFIRPLLLPLLAVAAAAQNANLQGIIVNTADGQPLAGVHVQLMPPPNDGFGNMYGAMSDRAGHFSMANLPPGAYFMFCERNGFVAVHSGRQRGPSGSVVLKPGENLTDFKIEMTPVAVISGRVLDQYGDPVRYVRIQISPVVVSNGSFTDRGGSFAATDDRGEFRLTGRPGRYYIEATPTQRGMRVGQEIRTDGTSIPSYGTTYFPDSPSKEHATAVEAKAGNEVSGIEIRLSAQRSMSISGQVTGIPEGEGTIPVVWVMSREDNQTFNGFNTVTTDRQGRFTLSALKPRTYTLMAQWAREKTRLNSPAQKVQLDGADVSGIVLALGPPGEISGTVEIPGVKPETRSQLTAKLTIALTMVDFPVYNMRTDPAVVNKEGAFHVGPISSTRYKVTLANPPDNAYIKTVLLDGVPVSDTRDECDFSAVTPSSTVKIVLSLNGGEISGVIHDKDGTVMERSFVNVFLASDPKNLTSAKTAHVKPDGAYQFSGIHPGRYRIFAVDMMQRPGISFDEVSRELAPGAEEIEIKEGDRITKNLTAMEASHGKSQQ